MALQYRLGILPDGRAGLALYHHTCSCSIGQDLMHRLLNSLGFVAFKMGRLRGGPSRTGGPEPDWHIWIDT